MIPRDFHFSASLVIWHLLWLIPLISLMFFADYERRKLENVLVEKKLQALVLNRRDKILSGLKTLFFAWGWVFAIFAWMGPSGNEQYPPSAHKTHAALRPSVELFLLIDVSESMAVKDGRNKKSRLEGAVEIADALISKIKTDSVALMLFTSELVPIVPLTFDRIFLRLMLQEISFNEQDHFGTNFQRVLTKLPKELQDYPKAQKAVILFSDGGDNAREALVKEDEKKAFFDQIRTAAKNVQAPIFTVGMGSKAGGEVPGVFQGGKKVIARLDESLLKVISESGEARYFSGDLPPTELADRMMQSLESFRTNQGASGAVSVSKGFFQDYFQIPLFLSLCLFLAYRFMPVVKIAFFFIPCFIQATDAGSTLFESGQYQESSEWFKGELKHLPPTWLKDKLLYDWGTSLMAEKKWQAAQNAFFAVSQQAYTFPIFRLRLLYNQALIQFHLAELKESLFFLETALRACKENCPVILSDLKKVVTEELAKGKSSKDHAGLDGLIQRLHLAALMPDEKLMGDIEPIFHQMAQAKEIKKAQDAFFSGHYDLAAFYLGELKLNDSENPAQFLRNALNALVVAKGANQGTQLEKDARRFYLFLLDWQKKEFAKGVCQCVPWNEALPKFTSGLSALSAGAFDYAYVQWLLALGLMENPRPSQNQAQEETNDIKELRHMQVQDREMKPKETKKNIGMPW